MNPRGLARRLQDNGISRRDFLGFCAAMAAVLGLPESAREAIAAAVESDAKPILVWLEFQDCAGNTESLLRATHPTVADLILEFDLAQLSRDPDGGRRPPGRGGAEPDGARPAGQVHCAGRGVDPGRRGRRLLHHRRQIRPADRARHLRRRRRHHRGRHLRGVRRHPGGAAQPDRRHVGRRRGPRHQEPHQPVGLSGQCGEPHGADRLLHDARTLAAARPVSASAVRLRQEHP